MSAKVREYIGDVIWTTGTNRLKLLNFNIAPGLVYHKISINKSDNTVTHNYKLISNSNFQTYYTFITTEQSLSPTNTNLHPSTSSSETSEMSHARITSTLGEEIGINKFKIATCQIKTQTQINN